MSEQFVAGSDSEVDQVWDEIFPAEHEPIPDLEDHSKFKPIEITLKAITNERSKKKKDPEKSLALPYYQLSL